MSQAKPLIAIVDDDESVRRALKRLIRSMGMDAETFGSGQEFIDLITAMPSFQPSCILMDLMMPGLSGLEVQERLAAMGKPLSVIFATAYDEAATHERALAAGAVAFLRKPFNDESLIEAVRKALRRGAR